MSIRRVRAGALAASVIAMLLCPAGASAWTVTVHVHGGGGVKEVTNRFGDNQGQMNCDVALTGKSESTITDCVGGTTNGLYNSGNVVRLEPNVSSAAYDRGWRFKKWVDGTGSGQINCDPQETTGDQTSPGYCEFQIFANLYVDLYFDDVSGPDDTSISSGPMAKTSSTSASFAFGAASDPDATFECRLDRPGIVGAYTACGGPLDKAESYSNLTANGSYTFSVRGKDPSGNVDATPATWTWAVDTVGPASTITGGPAGGAAISSTSPSFTFTADEAATFECQRDGGAWAACGSPYVMSGLSEGTHTVAVRAKDSVGNIGAATGRTFTVDLTPPDTALSSGPDEGATAPSRSASFTFTSPEAGVTFECRLDSGAFAPCTSPVELADLLNAEHRFEVRAKDAAGNVDATPAARTWRTNTLDADVDGFDRPGDCDDANAAIHPGAVDVPDDGVDQDCSGADAVTPPSTATTTPGSTSTTSPSSPGSSDPGTTPAPPTPADPGPAVLPPPLAPGRLASSVRVRGTRTQIARLRLSQLAAGTTVTVRCAGRGCPFKVKKLARGANGTVDVGRVLKRARLLAGARLRLRIAAPSFTTREIVLTIRRGKKPAVTTTRS